MKISHIASQPYGFVNPLNLTNNNITDTSISGPIIATNTILLCTPNVAMATAMANSKLFDAALKTNETYHIHTMTSLPPGKSLHSTTPAIQRAITKGIWPAMQILKDIMRSY